MDHSTFMCRSFEGTVKWIYGSQSSQIGILVVSVSDGWFELVPVPIPMVWLELGAVIATIVR